MIQARDMRAEIERGKATAASGQGGEHVKNDNGDVCQVHEVYAEEYLLNTGWTWVFENCTPALHPPARHAQASRRRTRSRRAEARGMRLVREPSHTGFRQCFHGQRLFGMPGDTAIVVIMAVPIKVPSGTIPVQTG